MGKFPREPEAFAEKIAGKIGENFPTREIEIIGPMRLQIGEHIIELEDLYRAVHHSNFSDEDIEEYIEKFINAVINAQQLMQMELSIDLVQNRILPRIHSETFLREQSDHVVHLPFVQHTDIVYLMEFDEVCLAVTDEHMVKWGIDLDDVDTIARTNLSKFHPGLTISVLQGEDGTAAMFNVGDGYDASRLLLSGLYEKLAPEMGGDFLVAIPNRDVFIAFPRHPQDFIQRLKKRIQHDYHHLPYPITKKLFYVTRDGIAEWDDAA